MHPDHVFGNAAFKADNPAFVAHHKMGRGLAARAERYMAANKETLGPDAFEGTEIVLPTVPGRDDDDPRSRRPVAHLRGRRRLLTTDNDLTIRDTATDTLILADLLFSVHIPTLDGSIKGWLALLDVLAKTKRRAWFPATASRHGASRGPRAGAALSLDRRHRRQRADQGREDAGRGDPDRRPLGARKWELFDDFHAAQRDRSLR